MAVDTKLVKELREKTGAGFLDIKNALEESKNNLNEAIKILKEKGASKATKKSSRIAAQGLTYTEIKGNSAIIIEINCETDFVSLNKQFNELVQTITTKLLDLHVAGKDIAKGTSSKNRFEISLSNEKQMKELLAIKIGDKTIDELVIEATATIGEKLLFRRATIITKKDSEVFGNYVHMGGKISSLILMEQADVETAKDIAMHVAAMNPEFISMNDIPQKNKDEETKLIKKNMENMEEDKPQAIKDKMLIGRLNKVLGILTLEKQQFVKDSKITVQQFLASKKSAVKEMIRYEVGEGIEVENKSFADEVKEATKAN